MKRSGKLLDAIGYIDDRYIMEAADITSQKAAEKPGKKAKTVPMRWQKRAAAFAGLAACLAVAVWVMDEGAAIAPFEAKTEDIAAPEAAMDSGVEATPKMAKEMPEAAEPSAYSAEKKISDTGDRMLGAGQEESLRSVQTETMEIPAAKVSASGIQAADGTLTCTLISEDTENTIVFGTRYYLECLTEDGWQEVAPVKEVNWDDPAYELKPGESLEKSWNLESIYGPLESGQYRIGIPCEEHNKDGAGAAVIYVEFGI